MRIRGKILIAVTFSMLTHCRALFRGHHLRFRRPLEVSRRCTCRTLGSSREGQRRELQQDGGHRDTSSRKKKALARLARLLGGSTSTLKGVGPQSTALLGNLGIFTVGDLLLHLPASIIDRRRVCESLSHASEDERVTLFLTSIEVKDLPNGSPAYTRVPRKVICKDDEGLEVDLLFFYGASRSAIFAWQGQKRLLSPGARRAVCGKLKRNQATGRFEILQPDMIAPLENLDSVLVVEPQYRLTAGLPVKRLRQAIENALVHVSEILEDFPFPLSQEWIDECRRVSNGDVDVRGGLLEALMSGHSPQSECDLLPTSPARIYLAYLELLSHQLQLANRRESMRCAPTAPSVSSCSTLVQACVDTLPFKLSPYQAEAFEIILADMGALDHQGGQPSNSLRQRMIRLIQGDVGSGKTIVSFLAMLSVVDVGSQACLLAPTEVLAKQHFRTFTRFISEGNLPIRVAYLSGGTSRKERAALLQDLKQGHIHVLVGTHAIIQDGVEFQKLGLAVIDEEQRFGVRQRETLTAASAQSRGPHVLYLSATPIPRSLCLANFGDMDVYQLKQLPDAPQRQRIETVLVSVHDVKLVADRVKAFVDSAETPLKVFWVLPRIEEREGSDLGAVMQRHCELSSLLGQHRVGVIHGRMTAAEKDSIVTSFAEVDDEGIPGPMRVLVATSIIEVGIDIPGANICIIENAERFGLSQLHQIRGRIGRGQALSNRLHCVLMHSIGASQDSLARLEVIKNFHDGFDIAEQDLNLRGPGSLQGVQQSGFSAKMRVSDLTCHGPLLEAAHKAARSGMMKNLQDEIEVLRAMYHTTSEGKESALAAGNDIRPSTAMKKAGGAGGRKTLAWDLTSGAATLIVVDVETSGLDAKKDRILQLAGKVLDNSPCSPSPATESSDAFVSYCDPLNPDLLNTPAQAVHGITQKILDENGARPFPEVWARFGAWLKHVQVRQGTDQIILLAHNAKFDYGFLREETRRAGLGRFALGEMGVVSIVDTLRLLKTKSLWQVKATGEMETRGGMPSSFNLGSVHEHIFPTRAMQGRHDALGDVLALEAVLCHMESRNWRLIASDSSYQTKVPCSERDLKELINKVALTHQRS